MAYPRPVAARSYSTVILLLNAARMCDAFNHPGHAWTARAGIDGQILSSLRISRGLRPMRPLTFSKRSTEPRVWMMGIGGVDRGDFRGDYGKNGVSDLNPRDWLVIHSRQLFEMCGGAPGCCQPRTSSMAVTQGGIVQPPLHLIYMCKMVS